MKNLKLIAIDIDGVLLEDTFSPVLRHLILSYGGRYSREIERNVFSRNQQQAAAYIRQQLQLIRSETAIIEDYFQEREHYLALTGGGLLPGAVDWLTQISRLGVPLVCYGGLRREQLHDDFSQCEPFFDEYIVTNDFRPGLKEILQRYELSPCQALFIDDVNTVAEEARRLGCGFIGTPSSYRWGWQRLDMIHTGVRFLFRAVAEISPEVIHQIDADSSCCFNEVCHA